MLSNEEVQKLLKEQFAKQPLPVQKAIQSAELEERMRSLAKEYNLLLDKWQILENQVTLTLLGFQEASELATNIEKELDVSHDVAESLATKIAQQIFDPIRQELQKILADSTPTETPEPPQQPTNQQQAAVTEEPVADTSTPEQPPVDQPTAPQTPTEQNPTPATAQEKSTGEAQQEPAQPQVKRGTLLDSYKTGALSTERKEVVDDPYRELPE